MATIRPSAGDATAQESDGAVLGGSRKNCKIKTVTTQNGIDHHQLTDIDKATDTAREANKNGQPSRAIMGCGY